VPACAVSDQAAAHRTQDKKIALAY